MRRYPRDFAERFGRLTSCVGKGVIGRMGMRVECEGMQVRLKAPKVGELVTVRDSEIYFHLPEGLPDRTAAVLVRHEPGRYIVSALGREWSVPMQCVEHERELLLNGRWLNQWDRRVRRAQAMLDRMHAMEAMRTQNRSRQPVNRRF